MKRTKILIMAIMLLIVGVAKAELPELKFKRIDTRDGLSNSMVYSVFKDSRGFVWFGTPHGLNRYDGYRVRVYLANGDEPNKIKYNSVEEIFEDYKGELWLRQGNHFCIYNPDDGSFKYDADQRIKDFGINTDGAERVFVDSKKNYWIKTYSDGLYCYNPHTKKYFHMERGNLKGQFPTDVRISSFAEYGKSMILFLSTGELICINTEKWWVSWRNNYVSKFKTDGYNDLGGKVTVDKQGNIWVIVKGTTCIFDKKEGKWYDSLDKWLDSKGIVNTTKNVYIGDMLDNGNQYWFCTDHYGLLVADLKDKKVAYYTKDKKDETSISDITLRSIYKADDGSIWIGSYKNGVNLCLQGKTGFSNIPVGDINTIAEGHGGMLWLGTNDRGVIRYNLKTGETANFTKENAGLSTNIIVCSHIDKRDGTQWFGTFGGGLMHLDNGRLIANYRKSDNGLISDNIWSIVQDEDGILWLATLGGGVLRFNTKTNEFKTYSSHTSGLAADFVSSMQMQPNGDILVGTSYFFSVISRDNGAVKNMVFTPDAKSKVYNFNTASTQVIKDSRGLLWYGTMAGVVIQDPSTGRLWHYDGLNGLEGTTTCSLIEDANHDVWVVTTHGVTRIVTESKDDNWHFALYSFNSRDGLQSGPFNERSVCLMSDGRLVIGGQEGLSIINTKRILVERHDETPLLAGMLIEDKYMNVGERYNGIVVADKSMTIADKVVIPHGVSRIAILLASDRTTVDNRARFVYKIEGLGYSWVSTPENNPEINLMGLSSGTYTLRVRMLNGDGTYGENERVLKIVVKPPYYLSPIAICIYIIIICVFVAFLVHRQRKKMKLLSFKAEQEHDDKMQETKDKVYEAVSDELRKPFEKVISSLTQLMKEENDEYKYGLEFKIREQVRALVLHVDDMMAKIRKTSTSAKSDDKQEEVVNADSKLLADATKYVEDHMAEEEISVEAMSEALNMSRVHLYKRLLALTGNTPSEFIRDIRLQHAERLLRESQLTVNEVGEKVGFSNSRAFAKYFKDKYGEIPSQYTTAHQEKSV